MPRKPDGDIALTPVQRNAKMRKRKAEECKQLRETVKFMETWDARLTENEQRIDAVLARLDADKR